MRSFFFNDELFDTMNPIEIIYPLIENKHTISTDSRLVKEGDLFFALKGGNFDGNKFALNAIEKGAFMAIVDDPSIVSSAKILLVENVLQFLQELASYHRSKLGIPIIALTGSNGKTTTKELTARVLSGKYKTYATQGNLNNHIGVPLTILSIPLDAAMAVVEMGANHEGEIGMLCQIARPTHGIITNIGKAHLEGFGSFEGVKRAKGELFSFLSRNGGSVFYDIDNNVLTELLSSFPLGNRSISYGRSISRVAGITSKNGRLTFNLSFPDSNAIEVNTQLAGEYNIENILAALCIGIHFGVDREKAIHSIESYVPSNSRSQIVITKTNTLLVDAYNANPSSMKSALENFSQIPHALTKVAILGEMLELGKYSEEEHGRITAMAEQMGFEQLIFIGEKFMANQTNHLWFIAANDFLKYLKGNPLINRFIFIKGSRGVKLDTIVDSL